MVVDRWRVLLDLDDLDDNLSVVPVAFKEGMGLGHLVKPEFTILAW